MRNGLIWKIITDKTAIPLGDFKMVAKWLAIGGNMRTRKPTHPGAILREDVLPDLEMSVSSFARNLGVSRQTLHAVLAERSGISAEMALRLGALLGNGAQLWVDMQSKYDLWLAEQKLHDVLLNIQRLTDNHAVA
jgi:addiction module HigA family antidote